MVLCLVLQKGRGGKEGHVGLQQKDREGLYSADGDGDRAANRQKQQTVTWVVEGDPVVVPFLPSTPYFVVYCTGNVFQQIEILNQPSARLEGNITAESK